MENQPIHRVIIGTNICTHDDQESLSFFQKGLENTLTAKAKSSLEFAILQAVLVGNKRIVQTTSYVDVSYLRYSIFGINVRQPGPLNIRATLKNVSENTDDTVSSQHVILIVGDESCPRRKDDLKEVSKLLSQGNMKKTKIHILHRLAGEQADPTSKETQFFKRYALLWDGEYIPFKNNQDLQTIATKLAKKLYRSPKAKKAACAERQPAQR